MNKQSIYFVIGSGLQTDKTNGQNDLSCVNNIEFGVRFISRAVVMEKLIAMCRNFDFIVTKYFMFWLSLESEKSSLSENDSLR